MNLMHLRPLQPDLVAEVLYNLRDADRAELTATLWHFDSRLIAEASRGARFGFVALAGDGAPVAVAGASEVWPGVFQVGLFATPRWPEIAAAVTRALRRDLAPAVIAAGAHRVHAFSLASHAEAHRWMLRLGARCEARLQGWGRGGEDFLLFAWRDPTLFRPAVKANATQQFRKVQP
jgi:hypothetical protein